MEMQINAELSLSSMSLSVSELPCARKCEVSNLISRAALNFTVEINAFPSDVINTDQEAGDDCRSIQPKTEGQFDYYYH